MVRKSGQTKNKAFIEWFNQRFIVNEKGYVIHQNIEFYCNNNKFYCHEHKSFYTSSPHDDNIEISFTDIWDNDLQKPKISLYLKSDRLDDITNSESKEKMDAMMATIDIANICNQYISNL